ncbi:PEP/pyruvate-binding domain-containing protein [Euzebya tangerina]|uniref:PEP/pyruvate-binding domain-containing protein n=1 Tax=Euzebya tangerina TaxID=591198 RepID=UPI000E3116C8|nr:PEP/pyruvate-binding domain-containing protein [Euzebya tangerina]
MTGSSEYVVWYDEYDEERDRHRVGGKNASLGTMMGAGLPVPPGFAVTTNAYDTLRSHDDLTVLINDLIGEIDFDIPTGLQAVSRRIRSEIEKLAVPGEIEEAVFTAYEQLCRRCGVSDVGVAVRSSATAEDLPDASFAGQQDTYLWVHGAENVLAHVAKCWSSMFTDRALAYRHEMGFDDQAIAMSVGIQKMVDPRASGVAFTLNPLTGDRTQVAIDASWGLGEAVVSGEVTPDNYLVDKVLREVVERVISDKHIEIRRTDSGVETLEVEAERRTSQCITDAEICDVAAMARRAEKHYGCPQDVEWALDRHLPDGENIVLLQARPETVWSQKARTSVSRGTYDPLGSIVSTLTAPLKAEKAN